MLTPDPARYDLNSAERESGRRDHSLSAAAQRAYEEWAHNGRQLGLPPGPDPEPWDELPIGEHQRWRNIAGTLLSRMRVSF